MKLGKQYERAERSEVSRRLSLLSLRRFLRLTFVGWKKIRESPVKVGRLNI